MKVLFAGDPHGVFDHINPLEARQADVVVLLGDMEPARPLHFELEPLLASGLPVYWIHGNHDADSDELWVRVWGSELAEQNLHGRVIQLADGTRLGGLGGVFRESVWYPSPAAARGGEPAFRSREAHAKSTPRQDRWGGAGPHRKHWGTIYPNEVDRLADLRADILITHEAPGYHPNGFEILDTLAQQMGVKVAIHGHHHDALDSSARWSEQGFKSFGVGLRGLSLLDTSTWHWSVVRPGELDQARAHRL
ncbi:metallophosphoesterase [Pelomonas sp. V22]|uniref:metallophosphoesterase family protein n=1 Tax=Pelomonas sp. V22 TaxID=2822139 RepID=UPI0024A9DD27|nr:metallophosphoesterase [Pelomonas sp. V22]MDI4635940.1 metallophosphoesterase [Pelomonas sp. V22]